jgi:hypothetical protein
MKCIINYREFVNVWIKPFFLEHFGTFGTSVDYTLKNEGSEQFIKKTILSF